MSRIVDRFLALKEPEASERLRDAADQAVAGLEIDPDDERARQRLRARKRSLLADYDDSILRTVGMTVDDLIDHLEAQAKRRGESGKGPSARHDEALDVALRAFIVSEIEGHDHDQAIQHAIDHINDELDPERPPVKRTVANWLAELQGWGATSIPPAR